MLARGQLPGSPGDQDGRLTVLQLKPFERHWRPARPRGSAKERPNARQKFFERKRLDDVVVRARIERLDARPNRVTRRQDQNGHREAAFANAGEKVDAVEVL